ncbi:MAG: type II toxin-antitoxin system VapC family toxin [Propionibacteriaceae bacterium]|nr:type II toxin-antitoxin system VapC family toxin [Propionibacteriaceae bacterium]
MRHLLDTHTVLWFLWDSKRLSDAAAAIIEGRRPTDGIAVSVASLWEFTVKQSLGKLKFEGGVASLRTMVDANGWDVLPIAQRHLEALSDLPYFHRDPFDRLLVATALADDLTLVTADENIRGYAVPWAW